MTDNNSQDEQLNSLRQENHELRSKIFRNKQRRKEYKEKFEYFQELINNANIQLNEGSDLIRKLQEHLKISQEKLSEKNKTLVKKEEVIHEYQLHITNLNQMIRQLIDEKKQLQYSLNINDNKKLDIAIQTSPRLSFQRRSVRFNLDKEKPGSTLLRHLSDHLP